jgi:hypothetical protein
MLSIFCDLRFIDAKSLIAIRRKHPAPFGCWYYGADVVFGGRTQLGCMAATAQAEVEATKAAQCADNEHAGQNDDRTYLGSKPSFSREQFFKVRDLLGQETVTVAAIAKETGLKRRRSIGSRTIRRARRQR